MKESELHSHITQTLNEFDTIEKIQPSPAWNASLFERLSSAKTESHYKVFVSKTTMMFVVIVLINLGFILNIFLSDSQHVSDRNKDLQLIAKEFLINPTSTNN